MSSIKNPYGTWARRVARALAVLALCAAGSSDAPARACSGGSEVVFASTVHPDLPLNRFAAGHLGLVKPTFARSYLTVAYRWLNGVGLDPSEQNAALDLWSDRLVNPSVRAEAPSNASALRGAEVWAKARTAVLGTPTPPIATVFTRDYAEIENCLPHAFVTAAAVLDDRARRFGAKSVETHDWIAAQDATFSNCAHEKITIPKPTSSANPIARADREYQIASAHFYAGNFSEAERRFRAIGNDPTSPWQLLARYLVVRAITREGTLGTTSPQVSASSLPRAEQELRSILADRGAAPLHRAALRYLTFLRARTAPAALFRELAVALEAPRLGDGFREALDDFTHLLDADAKRLVVTPASPADLTTWLGIVQSPDPAAHERALQHYTSTRSPAWLVATLMTAVKGTDARLDPALQAAAALPPDSPAYVTARFHRARILLQRGKPVFQDLQALARQLKKDEGLSTRNEITALEVRAAPGLDELLASSFATPAGNEDFDGHALTPLTPAQAIPSLHPEAAHVLSKELPLADLKRASRSTVLPASLRAHVAATTWVRASLLGDAASANELAATVSELNPALRPYVDKVSAAASEPQRRLALVTMLLQVPGLGPEARAWTVGPIAPSAIDSSYGGYGWCALAAAPPRDLPLLTPVARAAAQAERQRLIGLGASPTYLANEAVRLADELPSDPRVPEILHLAVRLTHYGCTDAGSPAASTAAYQALHRKFKGSTWAQKTPYHY
jgi:hypothetical protein